MRDGVNITEGRQTLERLARQGSEQAQEVSVVTSPGDRVTAWAIMVKSNFSYNAYNVIAVVIGAAGSAPVEIGTQTQAVNGVTGDNVQSRRQKHILCSTVTNMPDTNRETRQTMAEGNSKSWQFNRQINTSVLVQLVLLASLIVGSWVNLQRQLDLLQRDVGILLQSQQNFEQKIESLWSKSISYEYRLRAVEKHLTKANDSF